MKTDFEEELEVFRREEEEAQQHFFAYLGIRALAGTNAEVLRMMNLNSMFWITSHQALLVSTFITLGRVFDPKSKHNVGRLMNVIEGDLSIFTRNALRQRKESDLTAAEALDYVNGKHELKVDEVRDLKRRIAAWRKIFQDRYLPIRHHFAHKKLSTIEDINALLARTDIEEMKRMFGFLHSLHENLWGLFVNGNEPVKPPTTFVLPPAPKPGRHYLPGEKAYREAQAVLSMMLPG